MQLTRSTALAFCFVLLAQISLAQFALAQSKCGNGKPFDQWLFEFKQEALQKGIARSTIERAFSDVSYQQSIITRDRRQRIFALDFQEFATRFVSDYRLRVGKAKIRQNRDLFDRIERRFGVPAPVLAAFWGFETDFGANTGNIPIIPALATLAYDCRRPHLFRPQLFDALRLIERNDLPLSRLRGAWAGEVGQTQFMPSDYLYHAIDFDGDGKRNLLDSAADALASSANLLQIHGWRRGEPWVEEVRVPMNMPWEKTGLGIRQTNRLWASWGVKSADGSPLQHLDFSTSLLLPTGRLGPAFLAYANFDVYLQWNKSLVYTLTAAYFATRLNGAPRFNKGNGYPLIFDTAMTVNLQKLLVQHGHDVGGIDGKIGSKTRAAVRYEQLRLGLPADAYPTSELMRLLSR